MTLIEVLRPYRDDDGNEIIYEGPVRETGIRIRFTGKNKRIRIAKNAKIVSLSADCYGDGGEIFIHPTSQPRTGLRLALRLGHDSYIEIGENVGTTKRAFISAVEGATVRIGEDCMIATGIEIRSDDAHPIYDVRSGKRSNPSGSIEIGAHVWLAKNAVVLGGVKIGSGSVIGFGSIVTRNVPNNCIAVGSPARIVKRHIAWERPKLHARPVGTDEPLEGEKSERFWNMTDEAPEMIAASRTRKFRIAERLVLRRRS